MRTRSHWKRRVALGLVPFLVVLGGLAVGRGRLSVLPGVEAAPSAEVTFNVAGRPVRVIAVQTGTVSIKGCHHEGCLPEGMPYPLRFVGILSDPTLGARMPIWSYVVIHPEGVFVVDAGAVPSYNDGASWAPDRVSGWLVRSFIRLDVSESEALPARLRALGLQPAEVRAIVLTHQHVDHTGAVPSFPAADIWTTRAEEDIASKIGALTWRWRDGSTRIRRVDAEGDWREGVPWKGVALTKDGSLEAFHTPGHTPGSLSVRLRADEGEVWFVGDVTFRASELEPGAPTSGMHTDVPAVRALHAWFRERPMPRTLLPAHDADVPQALLRAAR